MTVYEVVLNGVSPSGACLTVLHYDYGTQDEPDWTAVADLIRSDMNANLTAVLAPSCKYTGITVREDSPGEVGQTYDFTSGDLAGAAADNQYLAAAACVVRKIAANLQRPNKGRVYQGMISSEGTTSGGLWTTTVRDALDDFWEDMIVVAPVDEPVGTMVIKAGNPSAPNTVAYNTVGSVSAQANPATQRRRRQGTGS